MNDLVLTNQEQTVSFSRVDGKYRPGWFCLDARPMLRFKDHEFLNIGALRITEGELVEKHDGALTFGGEVEFAGLEVRWLVRVARPDDGGSGFCVTTELAPVGEAVEMLEALTTYETPCEYDGSEHHTTLICQQPVYRFEGDKEISGAGYMHPFWYYGRSGRAHLTYPSASPLLVQRVTGADGSNERCTMLIGNWNVCSLKDLFAQPTQTHPETGLRGMKFLVGALNWTTSLHKDPNVLVEPGKGLRQEVTIDFLGSLPQGRWDVWLAQGWERMARIHFPPDAVVPACETAMRRGANWVAAAEWLGAQFQKPEGCPGFFSPKLGPAIYLPHTRPKWDDGSQAFAGQWIGPLSYLGHVWKDQGLIEAAHLMEDIFLKANHQTGYFGASGMDLLPMYVSIMRKGLLMGIQPDTLKRTAEYIGSRAEQVLNPLPGHKQGDAGVRAWDALANLLAADLFDKTVREEAAKKLLSDVNRQLDDRFWAFNCGVEGDLVGAGQARPFGHGVAVTANLMAYQRFGDSVYLEAAKCFGNLLLGMHFIAWNDSPSPDLDTRGWAHGATGGRDQWAQIPPWETGFALQQFAGLLLSGEGRPGFYDVLWLHSHTGLAMFPKARTKKRIHNPDMTVVYRDIDSIASEREFYQKYPFLSYENPWDQTMLAGYQSIEPLVLSLFYGGGLIRAEDKRTLALVPEAATYSASVADEFVAELWNPTSEPIETALVVTQTVKRRRALRYSGEISGGVTPENAVTLPVQVPARRVVRLNFSID